MLTCEDVFACLMVDSHRLALSCAPAGPVCPPCAPSVPQMISRTTLTPGTWG